MKLSNLKIAAALAVASLVLGSAAQAAGLSRYDSDTRTNSASTPDSFSNTAAGDTDGSLKYSTGSAGGGNKVAVTFYKADPSGTGTPAGGVLGTLGSLNQLSFDYNVQTGSTLPAVRLKLSPNGTPSTTYTDLVWEPAYNGGGSTGVWNNDVNVFAGTQFWQRSNGVNHDGNDTSPGGNNGFQPLSAWVGGFVPTYGGPGVALSASTPIYGVEISMGSGLPNNFAAYIDDVRIGFAGGDSFVANVAVPEPASLACIAGAGLVGLRRRRA